TRATSRPGGPHDARPHAARRARGARVRAAGRARGGAAPDDRLPGEVEPGTGLILSPAQSPIRILRVIARLNMGGPALHVAYLSAGLRGRGYDTTLVAGSVSPGEQSMSYVAE